jgi:RHS repeat-associated protein
VSTNFRFAGAEYDAETGLYHFWFRRYDPNQGRWMGVDPIDGEAANPQSLDLYVYVLNDPVNLKDPFGLAAECIIDGIRSDCAFISGRLGAVGNTFAACPTEDVCRNFDPPVGNVNRFSGTVDWWVWAAWNARDQDGNPLIRTGWIHITQVAFETTNWDWLRVASDFSAGAGDILTFGLTAPLRKGTSWVMGNGWGENVDRESGAYMAGAITGVALQALILRNTSVGTWKGAPLPSGPGGGGASFNFTGGKFIRFDVHRLHFGGTGVPYVPHVNTNLFGMSKDWHLPWQIIQNLMKP